MNTEKALKIIDKEIEEINAIINAGRRQKTKLSALKRKMQIFSEKPHLFRIRRVV
jgi:hypothetical protein